MFAANATQTIKLILALICCATISQPVFGQQTPPGPLNEQPFDETVGQSSNEDLTEEATAKDATKIPRANPIEEPEPSNNPALQSLVELQTLTQKIISQSAPAVVAIGKTGSGVIVNERGVILTASHVTRVANRQVSVIFSDGRIARGITLGSNTASDTGAIQLLSPGPFPFVPVQDSQEATPGTWCVAMGYPLSFPRGKPAAGRLGRVLSREENGKLVSDCTIMGGDSGGPLLNLAGKVIAISSSVKLGTDQNLYVPSEQFIKDWKNIALLIDKTPDAANAQAAKNSAGGKLKITPAAGKAYFGINAETDQNIVRIRAVHRDSPAEYAGIQANDVIVEMDSKPITSFAELVSNLKTRRPGDLLLVLVNRYGSLIRTEVTLGGTSPKK
jgi:serine protease Do